MHLHSLTVGSPPSKQPRPQKLTLHWAKSSDTGTGLSLAPLQMFKSTSNIPMLGIYRRDCRWEEIKVERFLGQSHFTSTPQCSLPDSHFRNAPSGQHKKDSSSFHRHVQFSLAATLQGLLADTPHPLFRVAPGRETYPSSLEVPVWGSRQSLD